MHHHQYYVLGKPTRKSMVNLDMGDTHTQFHTFSVAALRPPSYRVLLHCVSHRPGISHWFNRDARKWRRFALATLRSAAVTNRP